MADLDPIAGPYLTITLQGLQAAVADSADAGSDPDAVPLAGYIKLTPNMPNGIIPIGEVGTVISPLEWLYVPPSWGSEVTSLRIGVKDKEVDGKFPFAQKIINLADADIVTDASVWMFTITALDKDGREVGKNSGAITCTEGMDTNVRLLSHLAIAAASPTSMIVRGTPGADGLSAYQIAVAEGFQGTEAEWLASLNGGGGGGGMTLVEHPVYPGLYNIKEA